LGLRGLERIAHCEELNLLHSSYIIWVITSRRMRWAGHVACRREERNRYRA
jgi:hypothetical protein